MAISKPSKFAVNRAGGNAPADLQTETKSETIVETSIETQVESMSVSMPLTLRIAKDKVKVRNLTGFDKQFDYGVIPAKSEGYASYGEACAHPTVLEIIPDE